MAEQAPIRIIRPKRSFKQRLSFVSFAFPRSASFSILVGIIVAGLFSAGLYVLAVPPESVYSPGATLDPNCVPLSTNCTVTTPAVYSFSSNNFSGTGTFITTGTITGGQIIDSGLTASKPVFTDANKQLTSSGTLGLDQGGTNASLTASNGGIVYSTASALALSAVGSSGQILQSGGAGAPTWSTATYPATTTINQILYSSSASVVGGITTGNYGVLNTDSSGVPSVTATPTISTSLTIGVAGAATGQLILAGLTSGAVTVTPAAITDTWTLTLPTDDGTSGYFLQTDGSGTTSWASALVNPMTTIGDIIYGGASGAATRLAGGTTGQILQSNTGAAPSWSTATYPATTTAYQVLYSTATNTVGASSGLTFDATTLTVTSTGTQQKISYDSSNYATLAVASNGDLTVATATGTTGGNIIFGPATSGDLKLLSSTGDLTLGGTGNSNNEDLKLDFETTSNVVGISSSTSVATLSLHGDTAWTFKEGRNTTTNGSDFTITAGGALSSGTNLSGGALYLSSGISTGSGSSDMFFQTATAAGSGTTDRTPSTKFTVRGSGNVVVGTGTALTTNATTGFLYIPSSAGAPTGTPVTDTVGTVPIQYDTTNNRLYAYRGGAWHYFAETAGFQIPDFETADPISGEKIKEGDIVLGMINQTMSDNALHGVWVTWNSVKAQLLAEARGELSRAGTWGSGSVEGVDTTPLIDKLKNLLLTFGISVKDGITEINNLAAKTFSSENAKINTAEINVANVQKLQMVDQSTGETYCTWISQGEWQKVKGSCNAVISVAESGSENASTPTTTEQAQATIQKANEIAKQAQQAQESNALSQEKLLEAEEKLKKEKQKSEETTPPAEETAPEQNEPAAPETQPAEEAMPAEEQPPAPEAQTTEETPAEETPSGEIIPPVGELIEQAASSFINGMWNFIRYIFGATSEKISKIIPDKILSLKINFSLPEIKFFTAGFSQPIKAFFTK